MRLCLLSSLSDVPQQLEIPWAASAMLTTPGKGQVSDVESCTSKVYQLASSERGGVKALILLNRQRLYPVVQREGCLGGGQTIPPKKQCHVLDQGGGA